MKRRRIRRAVRAAAEAYAEGQAQIDAELVQRIEDGREHAQIVGGPRDGQIVPIVGVLMHEAVLLISAFGSDGELPRQPPEPRTYRLLRRGQAFAVPDPLAPQTTDLDLDVAGGNRYVLIA